MFPVPVAWRVNLASPAAALNLPFRSGH